MKENDRLIQTALSRTVAGTGTLQLIEISNFDVFFTPIEKRFETLTRLSRRSLAVPVAAITGVMDGQQWFKSVAGWAVSKLPLKDSLCRWTVDEGQVTIIPDLTADPRYADHPLVARPGFKFYAGCPLRGGEGEVMGTFCVLDIKPRSLSPEDERVFIDLADLAQREVQTVEAGIAYRQLLSKLGVARREALVDPLTRVWNRRGAKSLVRALVKESDEASFEVSACVIDVDGFKQINDVFGHQVGDQVIRRVAARLVDSLRQEDIVCRLGGDEFLVILPHLTLQEARLTAERLRAVVAESPVPTRQESVRVTISIGCASRKPGQDMEPLALIEIADQALLASKSGGRNQVQIAGSQLLHTRAAR